MKIPNSLAIIMDGNARWAIKNNLPIREGHNKGAQTLKEIINLVIKYKIKYLTIYSLSNDNFKRPKEEIDNLFTIIKYHLNKEDNFINDNNINVKFIGRIDDIEDDYIINSISNIEQKTINNNNLFLNIAFNYSSRLEIEDMVKKIYKDIKYNQLKYNDINEDLIKNNLYNKDLPDPDLLIRSGKECRLSNFLLWQLSYSELYFSNKLWPEFNEEDLILAFKSFSDRKRRYGKRI